MSAETLRRAAALMRERAEAASDGPWEALALGSEGYAVLGDRPAESQRRSRLRVARLGWEDWDTDRANAEHIASWHPAVALAVADVLEAVAEAWPVSEPDYWSTARAEAMGHRQALTLARIYLEEADR